MLLSAAFAALAPGGLNAQLAGAEGDIGSLAGTPIPAVFERVGGSPLTPNFVTDEAAAIGLGKALFWDQQAGSDGQACASCHFNAGADNRIKNQLNPGLRGGNGLFDRTKSGGAGGPNYTLRGTDFPFYRLADPNDRDSELLFDSDDVASSQGVVGTVFNDIVEGQFDLSNLQAEDDCDLEGGGLGDPVGFHVGGLNTRRVEPRNTPTVINAVHTFRLFHDGRANNIFNGADPFGRRNEDARVLQVQLSGDVAPTKVEFENAALASQAVGPPLSSFEMSCAGRTFPKLGKKMLSNTPLGLQLVDIEDSVLGYLSAQNEQLSNPGLNTTYAELIQRAFHHSLWDSDGLFDADQIEIGTGVPANTNQFTLMESNFALFWGLAIQLYESTLVSDQSPFDAFAEGETTALNASEQSGLEIFLEDGNCVGCHATAMFTKASTLHLGDEAQDEGLVERMLMGQEEFHYQVTAGGLADSAFEAREILCTKIRPSLTDEVRERRITKVQQWMADLPGARLVRVMLNRRKRLLCVSYAAAEAKTGVSFHVSAQGTPIEVGVAALPPNVQGSFDVAITPTVSPDTGTYCVTYRKGGRYRQRKIDEIERLLASSPTAHRFSRMASRRRHARVTCVTGASAEALKIAQYGREVGEIVGGAVTTGAAMSCAYNVDAMTFDADGDSGTSGATTDVQVHGVVKAGSDDGCPAGATATVIDGDPYHLTFVADGDTAPLVDRDVDEGDVVIQTPAVYDNGHYNIATRPTSEDIGIGGDGPFGHPLSFSRQYIAQLMGETPPESFQTDPCAFEIPFNPAIDIFFFPGGFAPPVTCEGEDDTFFTTAVPATNAANQHAIAAIRTAVDGAFKVPTLRNVELTGPFFHNGGEKSLKEVVLFYNRGGNYADENRLNLDPDIHPLGLDEELQGDLVAFLKTLTDYRVKCELAPFDHPQLLLPNGHVGDDFIVTDGDQDAAADTALLEIPAVGSGGLPDKSLPCEVDFEERLTLGP